MCNSQTLQGQYCNILENELYAKNRKPILMICKINGQKLSSDRKQTLVSRWLKMSL